MAKRTERRFKSEQEVKVGKTRMAVAESIEGVKKKKKKKFVIRVMKNVHNFANLSRIKRSLYKNKKNGSAIRPTKV